MINSSDSATGKLATRKRKSNASFTQVELERFESPTGTFSSSVDAVLHENDSIILVQDKSNISAISQKVRNYLKSYKNKRQVAQVNRVLGAIEAVLRGYEYLELPEIHISAGKDGSLDLSWRFDDALLGVAIQRKANESSWFLLQGDVGTGFRADGYLNDDFYNNQLPSLFDVLRKAKK